MRFGVGWSYPNLRNIRQFYIVYAKRLNSGYPFDVKNANQWLANSKSTDNQIFKLSWSHYLILMRVENPDARSFYEIECIQQQWSKRQLQRQVGSCLYERLALSRDKDEVMRLAKGFLFEARQKRFTFDEDNYYIDLVFYNRLQSLRKTTSNNIFNL